jgi:UPF0176 protein
VPPAPVPPPHPVADGLHHTAFYKFVRLPEPESVAAWLRALLAAAEPPVLGSVLVAAEGVNGMLAGTPQALDRVEQALVGAVPGFTPHGAPPGSPGPFAGMAFKRSACRSAPFHKLKVHVKREIVPLGIDGVDASAGGGIDVAPAAWRELIAQDDVLLLDNRNSFEFRLGRFNGAVDPQVGNFRDFPAYVRAHADAWKASGQRIAMYCTGGIRCEKTSAWMADLGLPVYQLEGGILNYFAQMPDAQADWQGECFVFDNRVALDTRLQETDTTLEQVYTGAPDGAWRLARAQRLAQAGMAGLEEAPCSPSATASDPAASA